MESSHAWDIEVFMGCLQDLCFNHLHCMNVSDCAWKSEIQIVSQNPKILLSLDSSLTKIWIYSIVNLLVQLSFLNLIFNIVCKPCQIWLCVVCSRSSSSKWRSSLFVSCCIYICVLSSVQSIVTYTLSMQQHLDAKDIAKHLISFNLLLISGITSKLGQSLLLSLMFL